MNRLQSREYLSKRQIAKIFGVDYTTLNKRLKKAKQEGKPMRMIRYGCIKKYYLEDVISVFEVELSLRDLYKVYERDYDNWVRGSLIQGKLVLVLYAKHCKLARAAASGKRDLSLSESFQINTEKD